MHLPDSEAIRVEPGKERNIDDLTGKNEVFARLFGQTLRAMLKEELSARIVYEPYKVKGLNNPSGKRTWRVKTSSGEVEVNALQLCEHWSDRCALALRAWEIHWKARCSHV